MLGKCIKGVSFWTGVYAHANNKEHETKTIEHETCYTGATASWQETLVKVLVFR
jgi:hypothetical protein